MSWVRTTERGDDRVPRTDTNNTLRAALLLALLAPPLAAQTIDDGVMMARGDLCTGVMYAHDSWSEYWEGELERDNGNIGTLTTQSLTWVGDYGVTDRLNVLAMVPYVWTHASAGTLRGQSGFQDVTLAAKYDLLTTDFTRAGQLRAIVVGVVGAPLSGYTPDFLPMSIGLGSRRLGARLTLNFKSRQGWFLNGTGAYTWRGRVQLDRPAYFTDGQLILSDEVAMPDVFDYAFSAGYSGRGLHVPISFSQQRTRGGSDIRRQDMPFVSNRMNFSKLDGVVMYTLGAPKDLAVRLAATYTLDGRNVGRATTLTAGLLYTFHF